MSGAYYNEIDPYAAQWLRNLIKSGLIADGEVDERSIIDVQADDLRGFTQCHFFAGIGGWSYALRLAGWPDDKPVWTGSCPCQPLSSAGLRKGHADERHLWPAFFPLISECYPAICFGEQVASRDGREWFAGVRVDMETLGYACGAADLCAAGVGAPMSGQRLHWVATRDGYHFPQQNIVKAAGQQAPQWSYTRGCRRSFWSSSRSVEGADNTRRRIEPGVLLLANGVPARVARQRAAGNAIVPQVAAEFIKAAMTAVCNAVRV